MTSCFCFVIFIEKKLVNLKKEFKKSKSVLLENQKKSDRKTLQISEIESMVHDHKKVITRMKEKNIELI